MSKVIVFKYGLDEDGDDVVQKDVVDADHFVVVEGGALAVRDSRKINVKVYAASVWLEALYG